MNGFDGVLSRLAQPRMEPGDFLREDGLLCCGACRAPKQMRLDAADIGLSVVSCPCRCEQARWEREAAEREALRRRQAVDTLKRRCFDDPAMESWTFANDSGRCPQMKHARFYADRWEEMAAQNIGYLLWGGVGTGKSFFAGCIANALMEREVAVRMTNFSRILNDLTARTEDRGAYVDRLCRAPLLILDDFGMERGTEYGLEQVYNVIDSRYRTRKPLIITTNLPLQELQHPQDTARARIYDRVLEMCAPIRFTGESFRRAAAQEKLDRLRALMA